MEQKFYYHYCYRCDKKTVYTNITKNGEFVKEHCSVCGTYKWFNDGELKERYYKHLMGGAK